MTTKQLRLDDTFRGATERAQRAPSILNTQPWRWRWDENVLRLYADQSRQLTSIDPDGRLLTLSCGAALHHARVALAGAGCDVAVSRFPDPADARLLAELRVTDAHEPTRSEIEGLRTIAARHTDRRPFAGLVAVPEEAMLWLRQAVEAEHAWLFHVRPEQLPFLVQAARDAATVEAEMPDYQEELARWTHRPWSEGDGVPAETIAAQVSRPVPVRDFAPGRETLLEPGPGDDQFAEYLILVRPTDTQTDWLRAGEATSAAWLRATEAGLAMSVLSDVRRDPGRPGPAAKPARPPGRTADRSTRRLRRPARPASRHSSPRGRQR